MTEPFLLQTRDQGLYCEPGGFFVDPWQPVDRAVITHAHADHACWGCGRYLTTKEGSHVLRARVGAAAIIDTIGFGEALRIGDVDVSLHPAGHILGSAQVRIEHRGRVWVASGDYKVEPDATCSPFEPVRCHAFVSESTFGLPIYRWRPQREVLDRINAWWRSNRDQGKASLLFAYSLGKSQRILAGIDPSIGPILTHGAVEKMTRAYRDGGVALPPTTYAGAAAGKSDLTGALVLAPPSAHGSPWSRKFGPASTGFASGWMQIRGPRRRRAVDRGFVLSDHADWPGLLAAINATGAELVWLTHGYSAVVARFLTDQGRDARVLPTRYQGEVEGDGDPEDDRIGDAPSEPGTPEVTPSRDVPEPDAGSEPRFILE